MDKILLALAMTVSLAACNGGVSSTEAEESASTDAVHFSDECLAYGTNCGPSCGEIGGQYCWNGGSWPRGYTNLEPTYDCAACLVRGPSCGELGGNQCLQQEPRYATNGQELLGPTYDCEVCAYQH